MILKRTANFGVTGLKRRILVLRKLMAYFLILAQDAIFVVAYGLKIKAMIFHRSFLEVKKISLQQPQTGWQFDALIGNVKLLKVQWKIVVSDPKLVFFVFYSNIFHFLKLNIVARHWKNLIIALKGQILRYKNRSKIWWLQ